MQRDSQFGAYPAKYPRRRIRATNSSPLGGGSGWRQRRTAFSLIELLVVIAVISLLVSILLPSLQQAKELTRQTVCTTQVRHILMGYELCANERDGYIPSVPGHYGQYRPDGSTNGDFGWPNYYFFYAGTSPGECISGFSRLWYWGYLEDPAVFFCPTHTSESGDATKAARWDPYIQGTPDNITYFNCPWPEPLASYAQRWVPDAVYVGGGMPSEEQESRWYEIPSDYWFLVCPQHFYLRKGGEEGPTVYGYAGARVEVYVGPRGAW